MEPFAVVTGPAAPLMLANVDTDVIVRIERLTSQDQASLGHYAFESLRYGPNGQENPGFVFNQPPFKNAPILLAGPNFGCGSSREGAVHAIKALGVRCLIAASFGDIFFSNCFQNGVLPIRLPEETVLSLAGTATSGEPFEVDLERQSIRVGERTIPFDIDPRRREALLRGLDDIGLTLQAMDRVRAWQAEDRVRRPWIWESVAASASPGEPTEQVGQAQT